jgi:CrcB protein
VAGTAARAAATGRLNRDGRFPVGTLAVNVAGSLALGLLAGVGPPAATVAGTGLLGAFTTFSTFAADAVALAEGGGADGDGGAGRPTGGRTRAAAYVAVTLVAGVAAAGAGRALAP